MNLRKDLESQLIFVLFLRKKIKNKTLSVNPYLEKTIYEKLKSGSGSGYLSGKYGKRP